MRYLLAGFLLVLFGTAARAQHAAPLFFGKPPVQLSAADVQRGTVAAGAMSCARFLRTADTGFRVVSFQIAFAAADAATSGHRDLMGPFLVVADGGDAVLPARIVDMLRQTAAAHGKVFVDEIRVRRAGAPYDRKLAPVLLSLR